MERVCSLILITSCFLSSFHGEAQEKQPYPDSLKGLVIKVEPLSFLNEHLAAGIELPVGNKFLDITAGMSGVGIPLTDNYYRGGGFLLRAGLKFPVLVRSPFNMLYLMPGIAYSSYEKEHFDPGFYRTAIERVKATAIMLGLGYRHTNPLSKFYYNGGFDVGFGWANNGTGVNHYNFMLTAPDDGLPGPVSAPALGLHFGVGLTLKGKTR